MVSDLAEAISLVSYGNAYISGLIAEPPDFLAEISSFEYMAAVEFRKVVRSPAPWFSRLRGKHEEVTVTDSAETPQLWLRGLKSRGFKRLYLQRGRQWRGDLQPYVAVAFAGFSDWWIYSEGEDAQAQWRGILTKAEHPTGKRIWLNRYLGEPTAKLKITTSLESSRDQLRLALGEALEIAETIQHFDDWFRYALSQLSSGEPAPKFYADMLPPSGYGVLSRQVLFAASSAWVFGGMGSWNDVYLDSALKQKYDRVTHQLYDAVLNGLIDSVNSFDSRNRDKGVV